VPDQSFSAFRQMMNDARYRAAVLDRLSLSELEKQPTPSDTHPSLSDRLDHLGCGADNISGMARSTGMGLLDDLQLHLVLIARSLLPAAPKPADHRSLAEMARPHLGDSGGAACPATCPCGRFFHARLRPTDTGAGIEVPF
jgi:hypothetical protein